MLIEIEAEFSNSSAAKKKTVAEKKKGKGVFFISCSRLSRLTC